MNIYQIYSAVDNKDAYADLKQTDRKIIDFINYNEGRYTNEAIFIAQSGYTSTNIHQTDYVQTIPKLIKKITDNEIKFKLTISLHSAIGSVHRRGVNMRLQAPNLVECSGCGNLIMPHHVCPKCGFYKGKQVINPDKLD